MRFIKSRRLKRKGVLVGGKLKERGQLKTYGF
jgi:hypothetical protein